MQSVKIILSKMKPFSKILTLVVFVVIIANQISAQNFKKAYSDLAEAIKIKNETELAEALLKPISIFEKAIEKDSTNAAAFFGLAVIYSIDNYTQHDYFKAWDNFKKADTYKANISSELEEYMNIYFTAQDVKRRNKNTSDNMQIEREMIEDKLIRYVREENNIDISLKFIKNYPNSNYIKNVVHIRNYLDYRIAEKKNTIDAFRSFISKYPDASQVPLAEKNIEKLAYEKVKNSTVLSDYDSFINEFPESEYAFVVMKYRDQLAFNKAKIQNSIDAFDKFLKEYPDALQIGEANKLRMQLIFEQAKEISTLQEYNNFVSKFPEGEQYIDIVNLKATVLGNGVLKENKTEFPGIVWVKSFDNKGFNENVKDILVPNSREVLLLATTKKQMGNSDIWIIKTDMEGKMLWNRELGDSVFDNELNSFDMFNEDEFIAVGRHLFNDSIPGYAWILGSNTNGTGAWNRNSALKILTDVKCVQNEYLIASGLNTSTDSLLRPVFTKMKKNGKASWQREYSVNGKINAICVTDSGYLVGLKNHLLLVNNEGYIRWEKSVGDSSNITHIINRNNNFAFIEKNSTGSLLHVSDYEGNMLFSKNVTDSLSVVQDIALLPDGSFILAFDKHEDIGLIHLNTDGDIIKTEIFSTPKKESDCKISLIGSDAILIAFNIEYRENDSDIVLILKKL